VLDYDADGNRDIDRMSKSIHYKPTHPPPRLPVDPDKRAPANPLRKKKYDFESVE
jgi:hypothetical protein